MREKKPYYYYTFNSIYLIFSFLTSMIGYTKNDSLIWAILNFFFPIISWFKWIVFKEINLTIIKNTFDWFFK